MKTADSKLVSSICWTKKYSKSNERKTKITIHHMAGISSSYNCAVIHSKSDREVSANYYIGVDGDITQSVKENDRAWTSSSKWNDSRAITIEVSNNVYKDPWTISDASYNALINLCVDICKRNNINKVDYTGDKNGVLTEHRMFKPTVCPGPYIHELLLSGKIPADINVRLGNGYFYINGVDMSPVFDAKYYATMYPELRENGLSTENQLFDHFATIGINKHMQGNLEFNVDVYKNSYPDLVAAFGDDIKQYYIHYCIYGKHEIEAGLRAPMKK